MDPYTKQTRTSRGFKASRTDYALNWDGTSQGPSVVNMSGTTLSRLNTVTGFRNPNWKEQVRNNVSATTPFLGQELRVLGDAGFTAGTDIMTRPISNNTPPYQWRRTTSIVSGTLDHDLGWGSNPAAPPSNADALSRARNRSLTKFINACHDVRSAAAAGEDLFEIGKTLKLLRSPMKSLREGIVKTHDLMRKQKSRYRHRPSDSLRAITDTWLEYNFGVTPTVNTVASIIADAGRVRQDIYPVSASATEEYDPSSGHYTPGLLPTSMIYTLIRTQKGSITYKWKGAYRSGANADGKISTLNKLRLAPQDWVPTLYNVMPWSWMIDYFTNIGDIVDGICWRRSQLAWSQYTIITKQTVTFAGNGKPSLIAPGALTNRMSSNSYAVGGNAIYERKTVSRNRVTSETSMVPSFMTRVPSHANQWINLAAVTVSQLASRSGF
jgi:hypothetical protein